MVLQVIGLQQPIIQESAGNKWNNSILNLELVEFLWIFHRKKNNKK
jgi:hypothetical protein